MQAAPLLLGHILEGILNQVPPDQIEDILEQLSSRRARFINELLIQGLNLHLVQASQMEHFDEKSFQQLRIQIVAASSVLAAMNQHGDMYLQKMHPHPAFRPPEPSQRSEAVFAE